MRSIFIIAINMTFSGFIVSANNIEFLLSKADEARKAYHDEEAIDAYKEILKIDPSHLESLWRTSYAYQRLGWLEENAETKKQLFDKALNYAKTALEKYPNDFFANMVMAGSIARSSEFYSPKERVHAVWDIKKYADVALSFKRDNADLYYLIGWWNFELSKASWVERSLARILFGGLPTGATLENAVKYLNKAIALKPGYMVYLYDLATFYEKSDDRINAKNTITPALKIIPASPEDFIYIEKCRNLYSRVVQ